ncbi:hypothetical protein [Aequorivita marina]|uniref:hypothetical protein n=1 Tax=Aequorivita marina TaxID=3073654 RepID=UPI002874A132|nr:hypothetical protein [Aequorivita sp. S2608]MDS1299032.1 hypothetical protein [Aequorivita sp. S2608]
MNSKLLFLGTLFFLLTTTAFYAQKGTKQPKEGKTKIEKRQKMQGKQQKRMKRVIINGPQKTITPAKKRNRIRLDPLTQELIPEYNPSSGNEISILYPPSNMQYPNSNDFQIQNFMLLQWKATTGHTVEIKTLRENIHGFYGVVQDWTPFVVDEPDGIKDEKIPFSGSPVGHSLIVKILIRDTAERSQVKTIFIGHE